MFISFRENVFFTIGAKKSTISDYNARCLYHLTEDETALVQKIIGHDADTLIFTTEDLERIEFLKEKQLITCCKMFNAGCVSKKRTPNIDFAWVEVTSQCNLRCVHCYNESDSFHFKNMSFSDFTHVASELSALGVKRIQFIGGEPLLMGAELMQMIRYAYPLFLSIEVFTNGTLITDEWADFFKQYHVKIALSVYSYDSDQHDQVTKIQGSHKKTVSSIQKLSNQGIKYRVANVHMKNVDIGKKNTNLYTLNPNKDVVRMSGRGNLELMSHELIRKKLITEQTFSVPLNRHLFERNLCGHNCFSRRIYIASNLTVYPCVMERRIVHGSLKTGSLSHILKNEILFLDKDCIDVCRDCEFRYCCHDCRPDSITKDVHEKPWYCTYDPYTGTWQNEAEFISRLEMMYLCTI